MQNNKTDLLNEVASYYSGKFAEHGGAPRGVGCQAAMLHGYKLHEFSIPARVIQ
jgi:hypothetical protein